MKLKINMQKDDGYRELTLNEFLKSTKWTNYTKTSCWAFYLSSLPLS